MRKYKNIKMRSKLFSITFLFINLMNANASNESPKFDKDGFVKYRKEDFASQNCEEKRLDIPPGVMSRIPVQDQNTSNFCWSYAGAQLIDAWRAKYRPPTPPWTSPTAHAFRYLSEKGITDPNENISGANFLEVAYRYPTCSQEVVHDKINGANHKVLFKQMQDLFDLARSGQASKETLNLQLQNCLAKVGLSKKINWDQVSHHIHTNRWTSFANKILDDVCKNHTKFPENIPRPVSTGAYDSKYGNGHNGMLGIRNFINNNLNSQDPLPVGIRLCPAALKEFLPGTLKDNGELADEKCVDETGTRKNQHFAVIVGRRPVKVVGADNVERTVCQYLIRDSYGTDCNQYPDSKVFTPKDRCVKGQIWVDERTLLTNTNEAYGIPDRPN
jgi:hypothetical protein